MKILIVPDSFKDALEAKKVAKAIEAGFLSFDKSLLTYKLPLSDGGEGFAKLLTEITKSQTISCQVKNPLGEIIQAYYGYNKKEATAYMDMASASGLELVPLNKRNPLFTSTFGTGQMILSAVKKGAKTIVVGVGGSATNDGGIGMARAIGIRFLSKDKKEIKESLSFFNQVTCIDLSGKNKILDNVNVIAAMDVINPLLGKKGATFQYAKQKGANKKNIILLESLMKHFTNLVKKDLNISVSKIIGAGAGGGFGAGLVSFLNAKVVKGTSIFFEKTNLEHHIKQANLVVTAEGKIDKQFFDGKLIHALSLLTTKHQVPLVAFVGSDHLSLSSRKLMKLDYINSIIHYPLSLEDAKKNTYDFLKKSAYELIRLIFSFQKNKKSS